MASWDSLVVSSPSTASYAAPLVDFSQITKLPEDYLKAKEMARQDAVANAFRGGIPKDADGNLNYPAAAETMLRLGNYPEAATLTSTGIEMQRMRNGQRISEQYLSPAGAGTPGQPSAAPASAAPFQNAPPPAARLPTIREVLSAQNFPNDQLDAAAGFVARRLGVNDTDQINTRDPRIAGVLGPAIGELKSNGVGQVVQNGATAGAPPPSPAQRVSQGFSDASIPAHGVPDGSQASSPAQVADTARSLGMAPAYATAFQSRLDRMPLGERKATLENWATNPALPKSLSDFAEKRLAAIEKGEEPTNEQKNAGYDAASGGALTRQEAGLAGAKEEATAPYKIAQAAVREGGRPIAVKPNEVITTGSQIDPALTGFTDWAARKIGTGAPAAPAPPPQGAPRPGSVPNVPSPPLAPNSASPTPNQSGQSAFTPQLVRNPDGSVASTVTPSTETLQKNAAANFEKARETYGGAQEVQTQLAGMEDAARTLNKAGWSSTGTGGNARLALAKTVNSIWQTLGVQGQDLPFSPDSVASWEKLTKETTRLGFGLARTLGAREAMQIVQGAIKANPNTENTPEGFRMVLNSIRQQAERQSDYFEFANDFARSHGGDLVGAEVQFNKLNPPSLYAHRAIFQAKLDIPQEAVEQLRSDPSSAAAFDQHYGRKGLASMFLGNTRPGAP